MKARACGVALLLALLTHTTHATDVEVTVVGTDGQPVAGVAVLLDAGVRSDVKLTSTIEIRHKRLASSPTLSVVPVGSTIRFLNEDGVDLRVRASGKKSSLEFLVPASDPLPPPSGHAEKPVAIALVEPDTLQITCHLHSSVLGHVVVTDTPYFGISGAEGEVLLRDLPAGLVSVQAWHPAMLTRPSWTVVDTRRPAAAVTVTLNVTRTRPSDGSPDQASDRWRSVAREQPNGVGSSGDVETTSRQH